jgi:PAS domain S-box-containing protein
MAESIATEVTDEFIRTAFERCPSGLIVVDRAGVIRVVNQEVERLLGYSRGELIGQAAEVLVPNSFVANHAKLREQYGQQPTARRMGAGRELSARHKDGHEIPVEIGLSPITTPEGVFILGTIVDVSQRRDLEDRLRQTHKLEAIGNLASGIAHDFNNILLGIVGYSELARDAVAHLPRVAADLNVVIDTAKRGRDLVNRILYFTRKSDPSRVATSFTGPVRDAIQLLRATLPPGVDVHELIDPSTPMVVADGNELHQIAMNLATNAIYAMKELGGVLAVGVAPVSVDAEFAAKHEGMRPGPYARLRIADSGAGIPPDILSRIFEPFFTTKPKGEGTGLGLWVIHQIVGSLAGAIDVESKPGEGTRFDVYVPASAAEVVPVSKPGKAASRTHRILLVEDEERLARLGQRVLESAGFEVTMYTSAVQALDDFRADPARFDLIMTDNTMPQMTGLQFIEKALLARPDIPVLMVSGIGETMSLDELRTHGVTQLLPKPYQAEELRAMARSLLDSRQQP